MPSRRYKYGLNRYVVAALAVVAAVLVIIFGYRFISNRQKDANFAAGNAAGTVAPPQPKPGEVVRKGTLICLTLSNGTPTSGADCVVGLLGDDSKTYSLNNINIYDVVKNIGLGGRAYVVGQLQPVNTSVTEGSAFKIDGVIWVTAIDKLV